MIIVKNRELLIPNNERYIGTTYDTDTENRVFQVPRFSQRGVDLAALTFRLDIQYANEAFDTVLLDKEVGEAFIILIWRITSSTLQVPGTLYIGLRAIDDEATVKWSSFSAAMYAERHLNTPGNYGGSLTEIEQIEQDHQYMKGVVDELKIHIDYTHEAEAWAIGKKDGEDVPSTDETYHNNSKYYSNQASTKATQAANSATAAANSATQAAETVADTNTRFNNAVAAVTSETEVIDARVGADGTQYTVLKNRLDAEHNQLKSAIDEIRTREVGGNLCDNNLTVGFLNSDGSISENTAFFTSDFIPVTTGKTYFIASVKKDLTIYTQRHLCLLYDASRTPISATYVNSSSVAGIAVTVSNADAKYMRACARIATAGGYLQVEEGSAFTHYMKYKVTLRNKMDLPQLAPYEPLKGLATQNIGTNLLDPSEAESGSLYNPINDALYDGDYLTSKFIPVNVNQAYTFCQINTDGIAQTSRMIYLLYDADKNPIMSTFSNVNNVSQLSFTPAEKGYVRVSLPTAKFAYGMIVKGTSLPSAFIPYESHYQLADNVVLPEDSTPRSILTGKKWVPCGDSFTAYTNAAYDAGQYVGQNKVYPRIIALRNEMTIEQVFFASGRTMAYPADGTFTNSLTCPTAEWYYQNIPADADYITIMLGINDKHHEDASSGSDGEDVTGRITLGTINDTGTDTYYGAYNTVLQWLRENRPYAHVGIIVTNGTGSQEYTEAQIAIAKKWGYPYINLNGDERTPAMIRCYNPNMSSAIKTMIARAQAVDYDGSSTGAVNTHPNHQAHEYESTFIEAWLKSL